MDTPQQSENTEAQERARNAAAHAATQKKLRERADAEAEQKEKRARLFKKIGIGVVVVIALVVVGKRMERQRLYGDPLVVAYGEFANLRFKRKYSDATKRCVPGSAAAQRLATERSDWVNPTMKLNRRAAGGVSTDLLFKRYKLLEKTMADDKKSATLKIEQMIRTFRGDMPQQQLIINEHTVTMQKLEDTWKVKTFEAENKRVCDPVSRKKITPVGVEP